MNGDFGWSKTSKCNSLFDPKYDVVTSPPFIITKIMIQTQFFHCSGFKKRDGFIGPKDSNPAFWGSALIIEKYSHSFEGFANEAV